MGASCVCQRRKHGTILFVVLPAICAGVCASNVLAVTCPGLEPSTTEPGTTICTVPCQQAVCTALTAFFQSTYNPGNPSIRSWRNRQGWESTLTRSCSDIVTAPAADGLPTYCGWHGVTCCTGAASLSFWQLSTVNSLGRNVTCSNQGAVYELNLQVNGLNGSVTDETFQQSLEQLHACGLSRIILPGNALSGSLTDFWGNLVNLTGLSLGKLWMLGMQQRCTRSKVLSAVEAFYCFMLLQSDVQLQQVI